MNDYIALSLIKSRQHDIWVQAENERLAAISDRQQNANRPRWRRLYRQR